MRRWKILDRGNVPNRASMIEYTCPGCDRDAELPVKGMALAQFGGGVVFDVGRHAMPAQIQCPHCRRQYELD